MDIATVDELLSTTRSVRKRLDLTRPVGRDVILECIRLAMQAPTASNTQNWRWLVITDADKRAAIAEIYRSIGVGDKFEGYIKKIYPDNKIDVAAGKPGYQRVEDEAGKIVRLLKEHDGYLPYYDKSDPEEIYEFFGMSKKTFKMTLGNLYKQKKISLEKTGIRLTEN